MLLWALGAIVPAPRILGNCFHQVSAGGGLCGQLRGRAIPRLSFSSREKFRIGYLSSKTIQNRIPPEKYSEEFDASDLQEPSHALSAPLLSARHAARYAAQQPATSQVRYVGRDTSGSLLTI